jgi:hypothetical protein
MSWPVWVRAYKTLKTLGNTARGFHTANPNNSDHSARADEKDRDKYSRWALHKGKQTFKAKII